MILSFPDEATIYCFLFSTKYEYHVLADATSKLLRLHWLLTDRSPSTICHYTWLWKLQYYSDCSQCYISWTNETHWEWLSLYSSSSLEQHSPASILYLPTSDQLIDIFTKPLPSSRFTKLLSKLMLVSTFPSWFWGRVLQYICMLVWNWTMIRCILGCTYLHAFHLFTTQKKKKRIKVVCDGKMRKHLDFSYEI